MINIFKKLYQMKFQVGAHPSIFGDNCRKTYKYLEAEYHCRGDKISTKNDFITAAHP